MRTETWKERMHEMKERIMHPFTHEETERSAGATGSRGEKRTGESEHKVDEIAGSE